MMSKKEIKVAMKGRLDSWECRTGVLAAFAVRGGGSALACLPTVGLFWHIFASLIYYAFWMK